MPEPLPMPVIVGRGRSGTTLLRAMLDSHPDLAVTHEAHFISELGRGRDRYERPGGSIDVERLVADLGRSESATRLRMTELELRDLLLEATPHDYAGAVRTLLAGYARREGKSRYGDKTLHLDHLGLLAELLPEARFVHLIRDGRNATLAYRERGFGPQDAAESAYRWRDGITAARRAARDLAPGRYVEVRYEDLVATPEATLRDLCGFLELEFHPMMLRFHERATELVAGVRTSSDGVFDSLAQPVRAEGRDWRTDLDARDVAVFEAVGGPLLADLRYELAGRSGLAVGLAARWGWVRWKARMVPRKARMIRRRLGRGR